MKQTHLSRMSWFCKRRLPQASLRLWIPNHIGNVIHRPEQCKIWTDGQTFLFYWAMSFRKGWEWNQQNISLRLLFFGFRQLEDNHGGSRGKGSCSCLFALHNWEDRFKSSSGCRVRNTSARILTLALWPFWTCLLISKMRLMATDMKWVILENFFKD